MPLQKYFHPFVKTAMKYVHAQCPFPEKDGQDGPKICTSNALAPLVCRCNKINSTYYMAAQG